ncbi:T9SS type A sorting domain-containing protein, partial [bacterium]|nr:T9SS type A sorting domain-containing protein [bacterium]
YSLSTNSPCIDAGDPVSPFDPDSTISDIGAFYYDQSLAIRLNPGANAVPSQLSINAHPNPFNPTTAISIQLSAGSEVNLSVYDISGRKVATLIDGFRNAGSHEVTFDGSQLASGIYLYRLTAGEFSAVGKMVLMK